MSFGFRVKSVLKSGFACFDGLSMNGKLSIVSLIPPFTLSESKGKRRVCQQSVKNPEPVTD